MFRVFDLGFLELGFLIWVYGVGIWWEEKKKKMAETTHEQQTFLFFSRSWSSIGVGMVAELLNRVDTVGLQPRSGKRNGWVARSG